MPRGEGIHHLTLTIYSYDLRNHEVRSLNFWRRRWSGHLSWIGSGKYSWSSPRPYSIPLFTLGLSERFPWLWEASVWLVGVNRLKDTEFMGYERERWDWEIGGWMDRIREAQKVKDESTKEAQVRGVQPGVRVHQTKKLSGKEPATLP